MRTGKLTDTLGLPKRTGTPGFPSSSGFDSTYTTTARDYAVQLGPPQPKYDYPSRVPLVDPDSLDAARARRAYRGLVLPAVAAWRDSLASLGKTGVTETLMAALNKQQAAVKAKYGTKPGGGIDFTRLADGRPSGLDAQGRAPYDNTGALNPDYSGPKVPGQVGVPDPRHVPEWSVYHQEPGSIDQYFGVDEKGVPIPNPAYGTEQRGWHLGDTPPPQTTPLSPEEAARNGADVAKLDGYIGNLEAALPKTKDPKKRKAIQAKLDTYRARRSQYQARIDTGTPNPAWGAAPDYTGDRVPVTGPNGELLYNEDGTVKTVSVGGYEQGPASPTYDEKGNQTDFASSTNTGAYTPAYPGSPSPAPAAATKSQYADKAAQAAKYLDNLARARERAKTDAERKKLDERILTYSRRISDYLSR